MTEYWYNQIKEEKIGLKEHRNILLEKKIGEYILDKDPIVTLFFLEKYNHQRYRVIQFLNTVLSSKLIRFSQLVYRIVIYGVKYEYNNLKDFMDVLNQ